MKKVEELDLVKFVQDVYSLSSPQGMGFLHFQDDDLTIKEAKEIVAGFAGNKHHALNLDYVHGRACKMTVFLSEDGGYELPDSWFDHTEAQYDELLKRHPG